MLIFCSFCSLPSQFQVPDSLVRLCSEAGFFCSFGPQCIVLPTCLCIAALVDSHSEKVFRTLAVRHCSNALRQMDGTLHCTKNEQKKSGWITLRLKRGSHSATTTHCLCMPVNSVEYCHFLPCTRHTTGEKHAVMWKTIGLSISQRRLRVPSSQEQSGSQKTCAYHVIQYNTMTLHKSSYPC